MAAYTPNDTLFTKTRPFTRARSTRRSWAFANTSSAPTTSSRSTPRSSAKWLRVPAGTHTNGTSCSDATPATRACEPSPPAIPSTSAPRAIASRASSARSSPRSSITVSMPCACASATNWGLALPPPDQRLRIRTGRLAGPTGAPRAPSSSMVDGSLRNAVRANHAKARTRTRTATSPPMLWLRSNVANAVATAATATTDATSRTAPRRVTTYHAAVIAATVSASAPSRGSQLFQSTTTVTTIAATPHTSAASAQRRRIVAFMVPPPHLSRPWVESGAYCDRVSRRLLPVDRPGCGTGRCRGLRRAAGPRGARSR